MNAGLYRIGAVALAFTLIAGGAIPAPAPMVELVDSTYHIAACLSPMGHHLARCHAHMVTDRMGRIFERRAMAGATPTGLGPSDLRSAYAITATGDPGKVIAIVDAYGYPNAESDLAVYRTTYGLPPCTSASGCFTKYNQSGVKGPYPKQYMGWARETALDLDMASAMCPGCRLILVEANTNADANLGASVAMAATLGAHVISNSYGDTEAGSTAFAAYYDQPGVAVVASSGDAGYGVEFPAASPNVIAVGGTTLKRSATAARGWTETAWKGAGSGCSAVYPKPAWQTDTGCANRMVTDVSAVSSPSSGVAVYGPATGGGSAWAVMAGTSVAAPLIGGIYAVNGGAVDRGSDPYAHPGALYDVISGNNGACPVTYYCTAGVGYDGPTGLGTPKGVTAF